MLNYRWTYEATGDLKETDRPAIHVEVARSHVVPINGGARKTEPGQLQAILDGVLAQVPYPKDNGTNASMAAAAESIGTAVSTVGGRIDYCRVSLGTVRVVWSPEPAEGAK